LLADQFGKVNVEQRCILEKMQRSLARLEGLAAAMLDWSAGGGAVASMQLETGDLEPIVSQAVHEMGPGMKQKQIGIKVELEPARGSMLLDAAQLERVVVNLLENSCKFTPKHGSIEIRGYSVSGDEMKRVSSTEFASGYRIDVSDTGPGIDPQQVYEMFEEYASYGGCTDRGGAGLGLAICRTIIKAHKGRIWAASGQPGAVFSFFLPYSHFHRSERSSGSIVEASL
jgi:two-component system sensor histidine kinase KdpD